LDWSSTVIRFCRVGAPYWEIARDETELRHKLNGQVATVIMPAKPLVVRLWRLIKTPRPIKINQET
jgi:hypothetical protein